MRGKRMRMRNLTVAIVAVLALFGAMLGIGSASGASAATPDSVSQKTAADSPVLIKRSVSKKAARKASFSCGGKSYNYGSYWYALQGSGGRIGTMIGKNNGRYAVRMWRVNGGNASFSIGPLPSGAAWITPAQYEHCAVLPSGAPGVYMWAQIAGVGTWDERVWFS